MQRKLIGQKTFFYKYTPTKAPRFFCMWILLTLCQLQLISIKRYNGFCSVKGKTQKVSETQKKANNSKDDLWKHGEMACWTGNDNDERYWRKIIWVFLSVQRCLEMLGKLYCNLLLLLHHSLCLFLNFLPLLFHGTLLPLCHFLLSAINTSTNKWMIYIQQILK